LINPNRSSHLLPHHQTLHFNPQIQHQKPHFPSDSTPRPLFIVAPTHLSHIQSTILCRKTHSLQLRICSGGHDYEGLSYTSSSPFALLDLHNYNSVAVDLDSETAWVDSGATLGEVYHQIAAKSRTHEFSGGVCPTVGVGGFQRKKQRRGLKMDRRTE
ncbi:Cannabichromenic acid synthase, partial [Linum grandiflorum]